MLPGRKGCSTMRGLPRESSSGPATYTSAFFCLHDVDGPRDGRTASRPPRANIPFRCGWGSFPSTHGTIQQYRRWDFDVRQGLRRSTYSRPHKRRLPHTDCVALGLSGEVCVTTTQETGGASTCSRRRRRRRDGPGFQTRAPFSANESDSSAASVRKRPTSRSITRRLLATGPASVQGRRRRRGRHDRSHFARGWLAGWLAGRALGPGAWGLGLAAYQMMGQNRRCAKTLLPCPFPRFSP